MKFLTISSLALALGAMAFAFPGIQTASAAESSSYRASSEKAPPAEEANSSTGFHHPRTSSKDNGGAAASDVSAGGSHAQQPAPEPAAGVSIGLPALQAREGWPNNNQSALNTLRGRTASETASHTSSEQGER